jgi:DNA polymerase-3 subunit gamma/tau
LAATNAAHNPPDSAPIGASESAIPPATKATAGPIDAVMVAAAWQQAILPKLKPMARALFSAGQFAGERNGTIVLGLPNETHRSRCETFRADVEAAIAAHFGTKVQLSLVVDNSPGHEDGGLAPVVPLRAGNAAETISVAQGRSSAPPPTLPEPQADDDIDLDDLVDAPPESVLTPLDQLAQAFPGSKLIEDPR